MNKADLERLRDTSGVAPWRLRLAEFVESARVEHFIVAVILVNAAVLGFETSKDAMASYGPALVAIDKLCLVVFCCEIAARLLAYRLAFWRSGWNIFDFGVVAVALVPGAGPWAVLRSLRVLRVMRLLTVIPSLRKVVAAFINAIPGLGGVLLLMCVFLYTSAVLAVNLFGEKFPQWFGTLGGSLFSLFQVLTLEGWADMARSVMATYPWASLFFIPFIIIATFTVLNLFIGIIVSTMQELATKPDGDGSEPQKAEQILQRLEPDLKALLQQLASRKARD